MSFDFLLPIATYPDATPKEGLPRALDLAATIGGRVTAVVHEVDIPPVHNALAETLIDVSAMIAATEAHSAAVGVALRAEIQRLSDRLRLPVDFQTIACRSEQAADTVAAISRAYDVSLLINDPAAPTDITEAVLFGSGGPVIVLPGHESPAHLNRVVVAWDGSRAAARAVRDAMPILALAKSVSVLTLTDDKPIDVEGTTGLLRFLGHHQVAAVHLGGTREGRDIGEVLQEIALGNDAGMLVMGAFGHNRLREFVLGGATRGVLGNVRLPVLMSH